MNFPSAWRKLAVAGVVSIGGVLSSHNALAQTASLDAAVTAARQWTALADANQGEVMWSSSSPIMQQSIKREDWNKYLTALQSELGRVNGRDWAQVVRIPNPTNLPPGEYVNVVFNSRFAKAPAVEKVSLSQIGGRWVPVGYVVTTVQPQAAPGK